MSEQFKTGYIAPSGNIVTPKARAAYVYLHRPAPVDPKDASADKKPKYEVHLLFDEDADLTLLKQAAEKVLVEKFGSDRAKWPMNLKSPFRDQGEKQKEGFVKGRKFIIVRTTNKPGVLDAAGNFIMDESVFYSGCYCWATVHPFYYDTKGNKGVTFGLDNVQKIDNGDPLSGRPKADSEFGAIAGAAGAAAQSGGAGAGSIFD